MAGLANGGTFENVMLHKCKVATYNTGVGGLIGWDEGDGAEYVFSDITIGSSNSVIALWGSWDMGCGGVMGHLSATSRANMTDVVVAARLDVDNDVCGNYQYYQYPYAGMLIGSIGRDKTPVKANLTCKNVDVYIGPWADYYYCEFEKNSSASYTEDFQFSRVKERESVFDLKGNAISCIHQHTPNEDRMVYYLPFRQIYTGYGWGAEPVFAHDNVTVECDLSRINFSNHFRVDQT